MRAIEFSITAESTSKDRICEIERIVGYAFPEDYVDFLLLNNGGRPSPQFERFEISPSEGTSSINFLYSADNIEYPSLELLHNWTEYRERIPVGTIPIGHDSFGNQILLGISSELSGKILFWDHDREGFQNQGNSFHNVTVMADSFAEFIDSLSAG